ncbi:MAG: Catabolite control protein A [Lentisphaerae bacterium ADurb.Bin242]|nr:MAG: Catabolite control protein A [Lentisphaerae bacterium ADurb.Bin242]
MLSIREISKKTGLSTATVSRALDPRFAHKVRPITRAKVLSLCDEKNYRPSVTGRSFVTGKTFKVGMIFGSITVDLGNPLCGLFMRGVCSVLQHHNYAPVILHATEEGGLENSVNDFLRSNVADAYIIGSSMVTDKVYSVIRKCGRPVIITDRSSSDLSGVSFICRDPLPACKDVWRRIPAEWYGRTAFVAFSASESRNKLKSISSAAPDHVTPAFIPLDFPFAEFCFDRHSARAAAEKCLPELTRYHFLWCGSDLTALGVADALAAAGIIPGRDIFLVGYDNIEGIATFRGKPFLSTIDVRWEERGRLSAQIALEQIVSPAPCRIDFPAIYIPRQSFPDPLPACKSENNIKTGN